LAFIITIAVARQLFGTSTGWGPDVRRVVAFRIDSIAWGFLLYSALGKWPRFARVPLAMGALTAVVAIALLFVIELTETSRLAQFSYPFVAAAFGSACISTFVGLQPLFARRFAWRIADIAGKLSYPIYLNHLLVIYLLAGATMPMVARLIFYCLGTGALAAGSFYCLERPILAARPRYRRRETLPCSEDSFSAYIWSWWRSSFSLQSAINRSRRSIKRPRSVRLIPLTQVALPESRGRQDLCRWPAVAHFPNFRWRFLTKRAA